MIVIHRGFGMFVVLFGILAAIMMNIVSNLLFSDGYYQQHVWPKVGTLWLAGAACFLLGWFLKTRAHADDKTLNHRDEMSFDPKFESMNKAATYGPRHHLMYIPLQYWGLIYFLIGVVYGIKSLLSGSRM